MRLRRLWVSLAETTTSISPKPASIARCAPREFGTLNDPPAILEIRLEHDLERATAHAHLVATLVADIGVDKD